MNMQQRALLTNAVASFVNVHPNLQLQDHVTFTGFFDTLKEFMNHLDRLAYRVALECYPESQALDSQYFDLEGSNHV